MARRIVLLFLFAAASFAQDDDDDDIEIEVDTEPSEEEAEETAPDRPKKPAGQKGKKKGWLRFLDGSKKYAIELPEAWNPEPFEPGRALIGLRLELPGAATIELVEAKTLFDARSAPRYWRESFEKSFKDAAVEPRYRPRPHLHWHGQDRAGAVVFLQIKGNGFYVQFECAEKEYAQAEPQLMAAVATVTAKVELWPAIPKGYVAEEKGSFLIARHPSVKRSLSYTKKVLKTAEKKFKKMHGARPRSDRPIVVLVHNTRKQAGAVLKEAGERDHHADLRHGRVFTLPIAKGAADKAASLAGTVHAILFMDKYGDTEPRWFYLGERELARASFATGKSLPYMHAGFAAWISEVKITTLDALAELGKDRGEERAKQSFFYACMFHAGKYKKAYRAFLKDCAENYDPHAAFERHLLPIGYEKLRQAAMDYAFTKMQSFKPKK